MSLDAIKVRVFDEYSMDSAYGSKVTRGAFRHSPASGASAPPP